MHSCISELYLLWKEEHSSHDRIRMHCLPYHQNEFHVKLKEVFPDQPGNDSVVYLNSIVFEDSAGIKIDANVKSNKYDCYIKYLEDLNEHLVYSIHSARRQGAGIL